MTLYKAVKGYENYLVSTDGRVYNLKRQKYKKGFKDKDGYLIVELWRNGKRAKKRVHRLVAEVFIDNPENKPTVDHINRDRMDNRVENLRWSTSKEQRGNSSSSDVIKRNLGTPIIEVINDEVSVGYLSLREVPNISHTPLQSHINKGETDFTIKQRNGNVRHFKTVSTERSEV